MISRLKPDINYYGNCLETKINGRILSKVWLKHQDCVDARAVCAGGESTKIGKRGSKGEIKSRFIDNKRCHQFLEKRDIMSPVGIPTTPIHNV